jgi:methyl-accepting chemotaxis protein
MFETNWNNLIICLGILATSAFVARGIMRRSDLLLAVAEEESDKNREQVKALEAVILSSKDALGMGTAVKEASERTRGHIARLKALLSTADSSLAEFSDTARLIADSNGEVAASARVVTGKISDQSAIVTQSSSAIEEMTASINSISGITAERRKSMGILKESTERGSAEMNRAAEAVRSMGASMTSISDVVKVIRKVASQTNLLAMNAAIEAAHAGAAGAGFSVVAGEIRVLSEETDRQVKLIDASIKATVAACQTAMGITEGAGKTFQKISAEADAVAKAMEEIGNGLGEISSGSGEILSGVSESVSITNGVKEASGKVDEKIAAATQNLDFLAVSGAAVAEAVTEISRLLDEVLAEAGIMSDSGVASEKGLASLAQTLERMQSS